MTTTTRTRLRAAEVRLWSLAVAYRDSRVLGWGMLVLSALAVWLAFWPGLLSPDSNQTVYQASINQYTNWWTPFGAWLLHLWFHLGLGLGGVFAVGITIFVCGVYLCTRFLFRRVPAALIALLITVTPPVYGYLAGVSRDMFFLAFALLGFGLFGRVVSPAVRTGAQQRCLMVAAVGCEIAAYLCRQNAVAFICPLILGLAFWWRRRRASVNARRSFSETALAVVAAVITTAAIVVATSLGYSLGGVSNVRPQRFTYVYDLASISVLSHHDRFPTSIVNGPHPGWVSPPNSTEGSLTRLFSPVNVISLYPHNAAGAIDFRSTAIAAREGGLLRSAWIKAIEAQPIDYVWGRIRLLAIQLGLWQHPTDAYLPLLSPNNYGYPLVFQGNYSLASRYLAHFVGPNPVWFPLDYPWTWTLVIVGCIAVLVRKVKHLAWHFVLLPCAVALNYVVLLCVAMAAGFRYVSLEVPIAILMVAYVIAVMALAHERTREMLASSFVVLGDSHGQLGGEAGPLPVADPSFERVPAVRGA